MSTEACRKFWFCVVFLPIFFCTLCICNAFVDHRIIYYNLFKYNMKYSNHIFHLKAVCSVLDTHTLQIVDPSCYYLIDNSRLWTQVRKSFSCQRRGWLQENFRSVELTVSPSDLPKQRSFLQHLSFMMWVWVSQYSVWLRAGRSGFDPRQRQRIFILSPASRRLWGPPSLLSNGYRGSFPRG
jgi:hypothetical protein